MSGDAAWWDAMREEDLRVNDRTLSIVDEAEVVTRYRKGATLEQLAARFDVHEVTIRRTLERHQEARRPKGFQQQYDVSDEAIVYLRDDCGLPWAEIATRVGMKPSGVRRRYDRAHGVARRA